jgi:YD repeat-containing protein
MKRHNQILVAVLALQIVLVAVVFWPRSMAAGDEALPLLGGLSVDEITGLTIEDAEGQRIEFARTAGEWNLPAADDFPAKTDQIDELLQKLLLIDNSRLVTQTDASQKRLQVARDDFVRRVELTTAQGDTQVLFFGSSPSYGAIHVRLQSQSETYLTDEVSSWDIGATANSWVDTSYLQVDQEAVESITVQNAQGTVTLIKDEAGNWTLPDLAAGDEEANTSAISTLANRATTVTLLTPLGTEKKDLYGLDAPQATVTIQTADQTITLLVGSKYSEDSSYVLKSSTSPYYVRVNELGVQSFIETGRDDLVQLPATPTPEAQG